MRGRPVSHRARRRLPWLLLACILWLPAMAQAQPPAPPRVRLLATGGTISNRAGGRLTAAQLVELIPGLDRYVTPEYEQYTNLASSYLTLDQWVGLTRRINELFRTDPGLAGIVVTSGTDTLEELAYFLDLTVHSDKPVVVVGSMRNPSTLGYEGAANLLDAFRVAADPEARGKGVLVVLNDEINAARDVTKTDALRLETFQARGYGVLGYVDRDRVTFSRTVLQRHTAQSEFDGSTLTALPRVDVLWVYQGASGDLIKAAVDLGARGLVYRRGGRRGDERHPAGWDCLRARARRGRRDDDADRQRPDCAVPVPAGRAVPRAAGGAHAAGIRRLHRRRGPRAGQSPDPPDAGPHEDPRSGGHSADVRAVLTGARRAR